MEDIPMFNWFNMILAVIIGGIILFIIKAVRQTKADIDQRLKDVSPDKRDEAAMKLAKEIRRQDVRCTRCGQQTFNMSGTTNMYKCHSCNYEFEGPTHILHGTD